jgi:hypothetical protein
VQDLAYVDDIVLIANSSTNLQQMIDMLADWCKYFDISINPKKLAHTWLGPT